MGENLANGEFRIAEITVQREAGLVAAFVRMLAGAEASLSRFFRRTRHDYTRFNYLGEWHSHPSFSLAPSVRDCESMWEIANDRQTGANFAVLMIVQLRDGHLAGEAFAFLSERRRLASQLILEGEDV